MLQRRSPVRAIRLACSVSNMTRLLWSVHVHTVSALYRILTGSFCRLALYGLSLPVRTRNALQNNGTLAVLSARAHLLDVIFGDYCDKQLLQADSLQTLPTHQNGQSLVKPNECDPSVRITDDDQLALTACAGSR